MPGSRDGGDMLRVIEQGSPGGIRRAIGKWLRVSAALVNAADSAAEKIYPVHALAAAWKSAAEIMKERLIKGHPRDSPCLIRSTVDAIPFCYETRCLSTPTLYIQRV